MAISHNYLQKKLIFVSMKRHAYCILAHTEPDLFCRLVSVLDDPRNDIFVHVDKRTDITPFLKAKCSNSKLFFTSKRIKCCWGTVKQIQAELVVFGEARSHGPYEYYHLLSGQDLPIKSQDYIHQQTEDNPGINYIGFANELSSKDLPYKTQFYHLFISRRSKTLEDKVLQKTNKYLIQFQRFIYARRRYPFPLYKGANWVSITDEFCAYFIQHSKMLIHLFRYALCPDEIALQSLFMSSPFAHTLNMPMGTEYDQCQREIDWSRGSPYVWTEEDLPHLLNSNRWFARKISMKNPLLIATIIRQVKP